MSNVTKQNRCRALVSLFLFLILTSFFGCGRGTDSPSSPAAQDTQATAEQMEEQLGMKVVTVLMDLPQLGEWVAEPLQESLAGLPGYGSDFTVQVDNMSAAGANHEASLTRLRTEIMAGKGAGPVSVWTETIFSNRAGRNGVIFSFPRAGYVEPPFPAT